MRMRDSWIAIVPLLAAACFEKDLGATQDASSDARPVSRPAYCGPQPDAMPLPTLDASMAAGYSNGVAPLAGLDPDDVVTIDGTCIFDTDIGEIVCDDLTLRPNVPGIWEGIGYERVEPTAPTCAGAAGAPAPQIGVFSFGSLVMLPGSRLIFDGRRAAGLVAIRSVSLVGAVGVCGPQGGFIAADRDYFEMVGPAPGVSAQNAEEMAMGAAGAGGNGAGGAGGNCGRPTATTAPQFEPLCGGSPGGDVGQLFASGGSAIHARGGDGGGALIIAAGESISLTGPGVCALGASGCGGLGSDYGGGGGGAGGTILLEAPTIDLGTCWVVANGGSGGAGGVGGMANVDSGQCGGATAAPAQGGSGVDNGGSGGSRDAAATAGADGVYGGGGGGAPGFIRVRTSDCSALPATFSPQPTCETLVPQPEWQAGGV